MKITVLRTLIVLGVMMTAGNVNAQESPSAFNVMDLFYQGRANNCASIALIKAAMFRYGYNEMFTVEKDNEKYKIVLRDGTKLTVTEDELVLAKRVARFEINNESPLTQPQREDVMFHAYLAYAAIAKFIEENGYWGCENEDGSSLHLTRIRRYEDALRFITKTSYCTDNAHRLLGLKIIGNRVSRFEPDNKLIEPGIILYSSGHAVAVHESKIDCRGDWVLLNGSAEACHQFFEWYVRLE